MNSENNLKTSEDIDEVRTTNEFMAVFYETIKREKEAKTKSKKTSKNVSEKNSKKTGKKSIKSLKKQKSHKKFTNSKKIQKQKLLFKDKTITQPLISIVKTEPGTKQHDKMKEEQIFNEKILNERIIKQDFDQIMKNDQKVKRRYTKNASKNLPQKPRKSRRSANPKTAMCTICKCYFSNKSSQRLHVRQHTGEMPYKCEICYMTFMWCTSFKIHLKKHGMKLRKCPFKDCERRFALMSSLLRHLNSKKHRNEKGFNPNKPIRIH